MEQFVMICGTIKMLLLYVSSLGFHHMVIYNCILILITDWLFIIGAVALTNSEFSESQRTVVLHNVFCTGTELSILNCSHIRSQGTQCGPREDGGVVCQCMYTEVLQFQFFKYNIYFVALGTQSGNCEHNSVRIVGGSINNLTLTMDGRLEICINNAWGTVCNNSFRAIDAQVACNQLMGFERSGK